MLEKLHEKINGNRLTSLEKTIHRCTTNTINFAERYESDTVGQVAQCTYACAENKNGYLEMQLIVNYTI